MKKLSDKNFDEIFQKKFESFEVTPPESVLQNIKHDVFKPSSISGFRNFFNNNLWMISGVVFVIVSAVISIALINNNSIENNSQNNNLLLANNLSNIDTDHKSEITNNDNTISNSFQTESNVSSVVVENNEKSEIKSDKVDITESTNTNKTLKANAGTDSKICGLSYVLNAKLMDKESKGEWKYYGAGNIYLENPTSPKSNVKVDKYGTFDFIWTETNSLNSSIDTVRVEFMKSGDIKVDYHVIAATCRQNTGSIELFAPINNKYWYYWENESEATDSYRDNLKSGVYKIKVVDNLKCAEIVSVTVKDSGIVQAKFFHKEISLLTETPIYFYDASLIDGKKIDKKSKAQFNWSFGDGNTSEDRNPQQIYETTGKYTVKLVVTSEAGCEDSYTMKDLAVKSNENNNQTFITPNGDGMNDVFYYKTPELTEFDAYITNKAGNIIYEWKDQSQGWDGKLKDGSYASPGVYYYFISGKDKSGEQFNYGSFFHLNR